MSTTANQETDLHLIREIRAGAVHAEEALIEKYLPMVRHIVRNLHGGYLDFDDLVQEGLIGLLCAIAEYNPDRFDVKFSSFAYLCIQRKIFNAMKSSTGNKHRILNQSLSIHSSPRGDESRTLFEVIADDSLDSDPVFVTENRILYDQLKRSLSEHLSQMEYTVALLLTAGFSTREMEKYFGLSSKQVDNARTRVKTKVRRLIERYGGLEQAFIRTGPSLTTPYSQVGS